MDVATLTLAFRFHALTELVVADEKLHRGEAAVLVALDDAMKAAGLMDARGVLTEAYEVARGEAVQVLPGALDLASKLAILGEVLAAAEIDGTEDASESRLVEAVAHTLGVTPAQLAGFRASRGV